MYTVQYNLSFTFWCDSITFEWFDFNFDFKSTVWSPHCEKISGSIFDEIIILNASITLDAVNLYVKVPKAGEKKNVVITVGLRKGHDLVRVQCMAPDVMATLQEVSKPKSFFHTFFFMKSNKSSSYLCASSNSDPLYYILYLTAQKSLSLR
jgi:hypothetical protein